MKFSICQLLNCFNSWTRSKPQDRLTTSFPIEKKRRHTEGSVNRDRRGEREWYSPPFRNSKEFFVDLEEMDVPDKGSNV